MSSDERVEMGMGGKPVQLVLDLDGYEGPLDVLLGLAREQKVDIARISILDLADQYLAFIAGAQRLRLEIAADYLVMAAWLAYLKSRLLLPDVEEDEAVPNAEEMAEALRRQIRRLEAMQDAGVRLMARPQLGRDVFARGAPEGIRLVVRPIYQARLFDLLHAYGDQRRRADATTLTIAPSELYSVDDALDRLRSLLGQTPDWRSLESFLPDNISEGLMRRSALASTLTASLELARAGKIRLRQAESFGPIYMRKANDDE